MAAGDEAPERLGEVADRVGQLGLAGGGGVVDRDAAHDRRCAADDLEQLGADEIRRGEVGVADAQREHQVEGVLRRDLVVVLGGVDPLPDQPVVALRERGRTARDLVRVVRGLRERLGTFRRHLGTREHRVAAAEPARSVG